MELEAVETSYARWAPFYDGTFGALTNIGRRHAVEYINRRTGRVLEVGVGTGLSLRYYSRGQRVTGVDFSAEMLAKARARVEKLGLEQVVELSRMDARTLDFADSSFDTVAAMHVLSVVPEPERVMAEISRVLKPGGKVVIANHFTRHRGLLRRLERLFAPLADVIGWHSDFEMETVLGERTLAIEEHRPLPPLGMMTFLVLSKAKGA